MATSSLPLGASTDAPSTPRDFSIAGITLPVLPSQPTDAMFGQALPTKGVTLVFEGAGSDLILWARINSTGTWKVLAYSE